MDVILQLILFLLQIFCQADLVDCVYRSYRSYRSYSSYSRYYSRYYSYYNYYYYNYYYYDSYYGYSSNGSVGAIVGGIIGGIFALVVIIVVVAICCKYANAKPKQTVVIKPTKTKTLLTTVKKTPGAHVVPPPQPPQNNPFQYNPNLPPPSYVSQDAAYPPPAYNYGYT